MPLSYPFYLMVTKPFAFFLGMFALYLFCYVLPLVFRKGK